MKRLKGIKVLMLVDDFYEDLELWYPKLRLTEEGAEVIIAGPEKGKIYSGKHGYPCKSNVEIKRVSDKKFDALVLPGGFAPDKLRRIEKVKKIVQGFHKSNKLIAHICHAGWIPVSAGIMRGYKTTSTPGIKDDLVNAGAKWVNKSVVIDRNMVSSRGPGDLPNFCSEIIRFLSKNG